MQDNQAEVIAFLASPAGHPGKGPVSVVQTHGALVFLAGDTALKIKRAVRYDYMDLSTLPLREKMLRRELDLNQSVAPTIYRDVIPVTRQPDGTLALDGTGDVVEWVLRMWRFPQKDELAVIADAGGLTDRLADRLGQAIYDYHHQTPSMHVGGAKLIADILAELTRVFAGMHDALGADRLHRFLAGARHSLDAQAALLDRRSLDGHVRRCHGDLHLRNLVLIDAVPTPFDALEFDEVLGTCDVLYDLAFLIMDLRHRDLPRAANRVLDTYLLAAGGFEDGGLAAFPLFLAVRAAIRAMVMVQTATATSDQPPAEAGRYLDEALAALSPAPARLVAVGGLSGTGKTTVAHALAPLIGAAPGAVHLRSDLERKAMRGIARQTHLPADSYAQPERERVYDRMFHRAESILKAGHSVLLDATFLDQAIRSRAETLADQVRVPFTGLWLTAPLPVLISRVTARSGDASDADAGVVRQQVVQDCGTINWTRVNAAQALSDTIQTAAAALDQQKADAPS